MPKADYNETEWVEFTEPTAPISMADLMAMGSITLLANEKRRDWLAASIRAWHLLDAYGEVIAEPPSGAAIMRLGYERFDWLRGEAIKATVELPLAYSKPSPNGSTPAAVTA